MPVQTIFLQPVSNDLKAAYNPINFYVSGYNNQSVYCDIYFNGIFYKTLQSSSPFYYAVLQVNYTLQFYEFDIQDACQEFLKSRPPFISAAAMPQDFDVITSCYCKFRGSSLSGGIIVPEGPIPIQGSMDGTPTPGGGMFSNIFQVINSALQFEDNQDMITHLTSYKIATPNILNVLILPLSHRAEGYSLGNDYDHFPIYTANLGGLRVFTKIEVKDMISGSAWILGNPNNASGFLLSERVVYYMPTGQKVLQTLPGGSSVPWDSLKKYRVSLKLSTQYYFIAPFMYKIPNCEKEVRIRYCNELGCFDSITFQEKTDSLLTKSSGWEKKIITPSSGIKAYNAHRNRYDVQSASKTVAIGYFAENQTPIIQELFGSPIAFIEWVGKQSQVDDYIPIVISDGEFVSDKHEDDFEYNAVLEFERANAKTHIRN